MKEYISTTTSTICVCVPGVRVVDEHAVLHVEDLLDEQLEPLLQQPGRPSGFFSRVAARVAGPDP